MFSIWTSIKDSSDPLGLVLVKPLNNVTCGCDVSESMLKVA